MSKDQLKENIESLWDIANGLATFSGTRLSEKEKEVVNYFIEQAEQLKELKETIYIITTARKSIYESHEQVYLIKQAVNDL